MLIFSGDSNIPLAQSIARNLGLTLGKLDITTFPDNENRVRVVDHVVDEDCVVIQSTGIYPNLYYMELFFILDSLKRSGARSVSLVIPYLGYQRQDHIFRDGEGVSLEVIIKIIESMNVDHVISFDLHSVKIPELFTIPISHLSALPLFAKEIEKMGKDDLVLASPDMGGIRRIEILSQMLGELPFVSIEKNRSLDDGSIESVKINGEIAKKVVIVDDVISTGKTLISAAKLLKDQGAEEIYVMATHGIFAADAPSQLENSEIKKVITTDTINIPKKRQFEKLEILSVAELVSGEIKK